MYYILSPLTFCRPYPEILELYVTYSMGILVGLSLLDILEFPCYGRHIVLTYYQYISTRNKALQFC
jgi:hypothetical protein